MKITDMHVDGFGVWSDLTIDRLASSMTVFHGPNEAGKTTLMQFVRTVLYGFSPERRDRYLPPVQGGQAGGSVGVVTLGGRFRIQRLGPDLDRGERDDVGESRLIAVDGSVQRGAVLDNLLANVDEQVYTNVFAIGLRELQELATLNDTDAAQQLYKLTSGMDRVSLVDVMHSLDKARSQIVSLDGRPAELDQLIDERDRLRSELEAHIEHGRRWARLAAERRELDESSQKLEAAIWEAEHQGRVVESATQVRERWQRRRAIEQQLAAIPPSPEVPAESLGKLDRIGRVITEREKRREALREQRQRLRDEDKAIPWNAALWKNRARLAALTEHATWVESLRKHLEQLRSEIERLTNELKQTCQELGLSPQNLANQNSRLDHRTMASLRGPARAVRDETRRWKHAQAERDNALKQAEEIATRLEFELAERGQQHLAGAIERSGDLAEKMRRRVQIEERLDKLARHKKDLDEDCLELMRNPIMPLRQMIAWGSIVSFGVMLMMVSLFSDMVGDNRVPIVFFGMMCTGGGFLLKHAYQQISTQELDECQRQLAAAKKQIHQATTEREEIDASLPQGGGPLENRLKKAEEDLRKLEQLAPLEEQHAATQNRLDEGEKRLKQVNASLKDARIRWRTALKKLNLADDLTPQKVKQLVDGHERLSAIQRQLQGKRKEKEERDHDLQALTQRIGDVLRESELTPETDDPRQQIRQMADAIAEQQRLRDRRAALRSQERHLRRQGDLCLRNIEKLALRRQAMFSKVGADDEREYRRMANDQARSRQLDSERSDLDQQMRLAVGMHCQWEEVETILAREVDLQQVWQECAQHVRDLHQERNQLHLKQGELQQEMKGLIADRRLDQTRLDLGRIDEKITRAKARWRLLAVTGLSLERIRRTYETERQPETLNEASKFLRSFTDNRYQRIWTPLGKNALRVDDADGKPLSVEYLSQGTREAVFLSLRLALVAAYAKRGADLPLVLDDVLVNLDSRRAESAVNVLREFAAEGHQILLFTCHEHIAAMFEKHRVDTRELPVHKSRGVMISTTIADRSTPDETTPDETTPDETTPDETTPDGTTNNDRQSAVMGPFDSDDRSRVTSIDTAQRILDELHSITDDALAGLADGGTPAMEPACEPLVEQGAVASPTTIAEPTREDDLVEDLETDEASGSEPTTSPERQPTVDGESRPSERAVRGIEMNERDADELEAAEPARVPIGEPAPRRERPATGGASQVTRPGRHANGSSSGKRNRTRQKVGASTKRDERNPAMWWERE